MAPNTQYSVEKLLFARREACKTVSQFTSLVGLGDHWDTELQRSLAVQITGVIEKELVQRGAIQPSHPFTVWEGGHIFGFCKEPLAVYLHRRILDALGKNIETVQPRFKNTLPKVKDLGPLMIQALIEDIEAHGLRYSPPEGEARKNTTTASSWRCRRRSCYQCISWLRSQGHHWVFMVGIKRLDT